MALTGGGYSAGTCGCMISRDLRPGGTPLGCDAMKHTEFDWIGASPEDRKAPTKTLYRILRRLHEQLGGRFDALFEQAQGQPLGQALDPYTNIKRGVYDRRKMRTIHEWLAKNHFEFAQSQAPELFQYPRRNPWEVFLETYTVEGGLSVVAANQFGIASRKPPEDGLPTFRLGEKYIFELTSPQTAYVVAFEEYQGKWYPLALGDKENDMTVQVGTGTTKLPCTQDGTPIPLRENDHTGLHRFTFVLCFGPRPPSGQPALIKHAEQNHVMVVQTKIRVKA